MFASLLWLFFELFLPLAYCLLLIAYCLLLGSSRLVSLRLGNSQFAPFPLKGLITEHQTKRESDAFKGEMSLILQTPLTR
jgi:hypothetical protein